MRRPFLPKMPTAPATTMKTTTAITAMRMSHRAVGMTLGYTSAPRLSTGRAASMLAPIMTPMLQLYVLLSITLGLSGRDGGALATECDHCITVPSPVTARVQEGHILIGHIWCGLVDEAFPA